MKGLPPLNYYVAGPAEAPWVTFVPGIGNDASFWRNQVPAISAAYRTLSFDPWGHGDSPPPPEGCRFETIVAGLVQLWDELGVRRSSVVGLGFGGSVALAVAIDHPARVERVAACCCRPRQPDDRRDFWRARANRAGEIGVDGVADMTVDKWLSEDFRREHPEVDRELRAMVKRTSLAGYRAYAEAMAEMDFAARLPSLTLPTLLVAAEHDHGGGPIGAMQEMAAAIPTARLEVLKGIGHICNWEAPDLVTDRVRQFLDSSAET